jgi:hypothetical protein
MSSREDAMRALNEFRGLLSSFEERPVGLGVIKRSGDWCILYSRARIPNYADRLPREVSGVRVLTDFGNPARFDSTPSRSSPRSNRTTVRGAEHA